MIDCERVLKILKDEKPHRNFDLLEIFGGGFALAARIWDLRKPIGRYRLNITSGSPKKFGKKRISSGDWYYQLQKGSSGLTREKLLQMKKLFDEDGSGLKLKYFSMFSGIGGFEYGIERTISDKIGSDNEKKSKATNGNKNENNVCVKKYWSPLCIGFSEIDKYAIQIYKKHFPKHKEYGDATRIIPEEIPDFDLLVGGFPCQSFSIAGKRGGFKDTRGTLFFEIARIVSIKRPKLLLLENVKGLLSHDKGRTFGTILATLSDMGYVLEWQILNSKNFGVPQNRERVFIVGHLGEVSGQTIFPIGKTMQSNSRIKIIGHRRNYRRNTQVFDANGLTEALDTSAGGGRQRHIAIPVLTPNRIKKRQNGRRMKEDGDPSFTLTGQDIHGVMLRDGRDNRSCLRSGRTTEIGISGQSIRRLTPTECERLQGFPDGWTEGVSDTQRYKCLGNAVTTNVVTVIIKRLAQGIFDF